MREKPKSEPDKRDISEMLIFSRKKINQIVFNASTLTRPKIPIDIPEYF